MEPLVNLRHTTLGLTSVVVLLVSLTGQAIAADDSDRIDFQDQIKPLLSDRCFTCHGPDAGNRQADLRLDQRDSVLQPSQSGLAPQIIAPGKPEESEAYLRITSDDESMRMPPPESKLTLSEEEVALIRRWISEGAAWSDHWAFQPIESKDPPAVPAAMADRLRNEIDAFVMRRLATRGWQLAPDAKRETLIRRLSFDLTGLPPTPAEVRAFVEDDRADAYEQLVDRLLDSPRYGERMATEWMDVARYSDTYGYQVDRDRFVWPYRDWVVRAFNRNLPYDQFIVEQLAGDLLPDASDDQVLATTFNRLHPQKVEGGSTPEEFRIEYVADRTQTVATAFLGMTFECARCHDHKYDPISQKEYYQLSAFFDNIDEAGLYSYFTPSIPTPTLILHTDETRTKHQALQQRVADLEARLIQVAVAQQSSYSDWLSSQTSRSESPSEDRSPEKASFVEVQGEIAHLDFESTDGLGANTQVDGYVGKAVKLTGDDAVNLNVGNFRRYEPFSISLYLKSPKQFERAVVFHRSRAWTDAGSRGYELLVEDGRLSFALIHFWPGNAIRVQCREPLEIDRWTHVTITYDGSSRADGVSMFVNGVPADVEIVRDHLEKQITGGGGDNITIGERFRDRGFVGGIVDDFRVFNRRLTPPEVIQLIQATSGRELSVKPAEEHTAGDDAVDDGVYQYYLSTVNETYRAAWAELQEARKELAEFVDPLPEIMVMREMAQRRPTFLLERGAYDKRADQVEPKTPEAFLAIPEGLAHDRLGFARWLTDRRHPLTSRVAVNRYWQMIFGQGLVRTPEDFGSQGKPPTHPELLDWLAADFMEHGWDVKRLLKQMVMSTTYRQSSSVPADVTAKDPDNLWLARSPSYRWPAEMLRDNALFVSGLLVEKIGGPPVKPYELEASFKPSQADQGEGVYRRSLYTYWKRTGPAPVMMTLDASKRDVCRVRRERTSSPLQALVLMNGPQFVEAARGLAERVLAEHESDEAVVSQLYAWLAGTTPSADEIDLLVELLKWQEQHFAEHPEQRDQYLAIGQRKPNEQLNRTRLASVALVANTLFNFDACVVKR